MTTADWQASSEAYRLDAVRLTRDLAEARAEITRLRTYRDGLAVTVTELEAQNERLRAMVEARSKCECGAPLSRSCPTCERLWQS